MRRITFALVFIAITGGCATSHSPPLTSRPLSAVVADLQEQERLANSPTFVGRKPTSLNCATCNTPRSLIATRLKEREAVVERKEQKLAALFMPNAEALKSLDVFSPEYQEYLSESSLLARESRHARQEKANIRFLYLLQQEDHLFCFDPIFTEELYQLKLQYKKLHTQAQNRMKEEYRRLKKEYGQAKAEDRIAQLRRKELLRQVDIHTSKNPQNPLKSVEPLTLLKARIQKYYKVYNDPFQNANTADWVMPFAEDLKK